MNPENISLQQLIIHYVGSSNNLEPVILSDEALKLDEETIQILQDSFLSRFRNNQEYYSFHHASSLQFNEVYQFCKRLFQDADEFENVSASIAQHLYAQSNHPRVKAGELYVALFKGLAVESRMKQAIGLFKTETKTLFLDIEQNKRQLKLQMKEGTELTRIDKGCLIINNREEEGYDVLLFDNQNRGEEAQYWKEKFLSLVPQQNDFHHTAQFLNLTRQFITDQLESQNKLPKREQVELLNKSINYFKSNENFNIESFQNEVFQNEEMIESFRQFGSRYVESNDYDIAANFDISPEAVKKQSRVYKSVLKLDRNFHIYIHGRTDLIERGTDRDGRKYYKIYFQEES